MTSNLRIPEQGLLAVIVLMMASYLFVDFSYGALVLMGLSGLKISLAFKAALLSLIMLYVAVYKPRLALICLASVAVFIAPIVLSLLRDPDLSGFIYNLTFASKFLAPIVVYCFWCAIADKPNRLKTSRFVLWALTFAVIFNSVLGAFGIGFHSYGTPESGLGNPGLIFAANEYGALLIVVSGFLLNESWLKGGLLFSVIAGLSLLVTLMVATKTALLGVVMLIGLVPLLNERRHLFRPTVLKLKYLIATLLVSCLAVLLFAQLIAELGLIDRALFFYETGGVSRLIFSGREAMAVAMVDLYTRAGDLFHWVLGAPPSFFTGHGVKPTAELDPFDLLLWFGPLSFTVIIVWISIVLTSAWKALSSTNSREAPAVLAVNLALLAAASVAGHVWTSGVVGVAWATLNSTTALLPVRDSDKSEDAERAAGYAAA